MQKLYVIAAVIGLLAGPARAGRIECVTTNTVDVTSLLSATVIQVKGGNVNADVTVYSSDSAVDGPTTCSVGGAVTCNGWDTDAQAEIWKKCDRNAPWLQMGNTATLTATDKNYSITLESDCLIALKLVDPGATSSACLYLAVTSEKGLDPTKEVQDGSEKGSWARLRSDFE